MYMLSMQWGLTGGTDWMDVLCAVHKSLDTTGGDTFFGLYVEYAVGVLTGFWFICCVCSGV